MSNNYGCPPCPNTQRHTRTPGSEGCPRSDTYRMFENGTAQVIFGWTFRCRTCNTIFFRSSSDGIRHGITRGQNERAMKRLAAEEAKAKRA